jgi:hypothetical protein
MEQPSEASIKAALGCELAAPTLLSAILRWAEAKKKMHEPCPICDLDDSGQDCRCSEYNVKLNEAEAALQVVAAGWEQFGYEPGTKLPDGAQMIDGEWYIPKWGCDSLEASLEASLAILQNVKVLADALRVGSSGWLDGSTAPKDGSYIVAVGRVIYSDDFTTCVDSFVAKITWRAEPNEGWHYDNNMSVANMLGDEVRVDYWLPMPANGGHQR